MILGLANEVVSATLAGLFVCGEKFYNRMVETGIVKRLNCAEILESYIQHWKTSGA
ncbi:MAG: hypothetical protein ABSF53_17285 [Terracidiphilus sp.]